jgi:hypothetical protein
MVQAPANDLAVCRDIQIHNITPIPTAFETNELIPPPYDQFNLASTFDAAYSTGSGSKRAGSLILRTSGPAQICIKGTGKTAEAVFSGGKRF